MRNLWYVAHQIKNTFLLAFAPLGTIYVAYKYIYTLYIDDN